MLEFPLTHRLSVCGTGVCPGGMLRRSRVTNPCSAQPARHNLRRPDRGIRAHFVGNASGLFNEGRHNIGLGYRLDDLTLDEDLTLAVSRCHAEVGLTPLARSVDNTPHDGNAQWNGHSFQPVGDIISDLVDINLRATTRRARDNLQLPLPQIQRLQDLQPDLDLLCGRCREGHSNGVANALTKQDSECCCTLDRALERWPG